MLKVARHHPDSVLEPVRTLDFVCPLCRGELGVNGNSYECEPCARVYQVQGGIPDFRVLPDPYLDAAADYRRTELVLGVLDCLDLRQLLEFYWGHSDITPPDLRAKFIQNALRGEHRARRIQRLLQSGTFQRPVEAQRVLEIGSGSGNYLVEAVQRFPMVVGIDIGMRWLHITRRRFRDRRLPLPPLVCCSAEYLPFGDGAFDLAICCSTLEFTWQPERVLTEAARVLSADGSLYLDTVNRFSIARNPYTYLWGVGFLPRKWQPAYVRWRRKTSFEMVKMVSLPQLQRLARQSFAKVEVELPDVDDEILRSMPILTRIQIAAYRLLKRLPVFRQALIWVGPQWDVKLTKGDAECQSQ